MKVTLFNHKDIDVYCKFSGRKLTTFVKVDLDLSLRNFLCFIVAIPNASFCSRNPFRALLSALEHQTQAAEKYNSVKEHLYGKQRGAAQ